MQVPAVVPFLTALFLATTVSNAFSTNPQISLDYINLSGNYSSKYNITYFRKIPFAAPPLPPTNRFRAPQPPLIHDKNEVYNTDQDFDMCPQRTVNGSEDCLYLGVYSRPWIPERNTRKSTGRPVLVNFYGGAFIEGSASWTLPPPLYPILNVSDSNDFVIVQPNYRVNAFGFLPGRKIKNSRTANLNVGLLDQRFAIEWVKNNIHHFGGNPNNISIWGQSAGAGSVVGQVLSSSQAGLSLFSKATTSSPFWPKTYRYDDSEAESIYDQLVSLTSCDHAEDSLECLKNTDVQTLRNASLIIDADHTYTTSSYTWAPVIDGEFLRESLSETVLSRKVNIDYIYGVYNAHEGENFIPPGLQNLSTVNGYNSSFVSYDYWLRGFLPRFTEEQLRQVNQVYPENGSAETIAAYNTTYERAQLIYRDLVLACPSYWLASSARIQGWLTEYAIPPAKHGSDTIYWDKINEVQNTDPLIYDTYAGAFASFFQTANPNAHKLRNGSITEVPELQQTGEEFVVATESLQRLKLSQLNKRCDFWLRNAKSVPI